MVRKSSLIFLVLLTACGRVQPPATNVEQPAAAKIETPATIPGIAAVDVYGNLEPRGFKTETEPGVWRSTFATPALQFSAEAFGEMPEQITAVRATALLISAPPERAAEFLAFVASLPYDGSEPDNASAWVSSSVLNAQPGQTEIGQVRFALLQSEQSWLLRMAPVAN